MKYLKEKNIGHGLSLNKIYNMDCIEGMKLLADNSVDAIVTDPPYGLSFMGKKRDYDVPSQEIREEALRVLKPGGYLLSFAGTRTQHRMAVRIEDAGFEIRDMIAWVYGSGFPKSLNIGKAIDKRGGNVLLTKEIGDVLRIAREKRGITKSQADDKYCGGTTNWSWFEGRQDGQRIPPSNILELVSKDREELKYYVDIVKEAEREVIGEHPSIKGNGSVFNVEFTNGTPMITAPATEQAKQREGRGTALKPALEPITVARKPIEGTVAENCLKRGTGGINIDESRVEAGPDHIKNATRHTNKIYRGGFNDSPINSDASPLGRFPANFIHDGSDEVVGLFPKVKTGSITKDIQGRESNSLGKFNQFTGRHTGDSGSASRFFYCAKASKSERNKGCEGLEEKIVNDGREKDIDNAYQMGITLRKNTHPTVKPIALMEYLVKLVSREDAVVLDPFTGSGSTLIACKKLKRQYIGFELDEGYRNIANKRIQDSLSEK